MKRSLGFYIALLCGSFLSPILSAPLVNEDFFPYSNGWLGADAAYSVPLDATRTVWLFGDTFVGDHRAESTMIHNSLAIRTCRESCEFRYFWSGQHTSHPDSFFRTHESNYLWPLDGSTAGGKLYIFLEQMRSTGAGGAFGFDYKSVSLATISNPTADPTKWLISYRVVSEGNQVVPGIATAIVEESKQTYLYAFTLFRRSASEPFVGLLRYRLNDIESGDDRLSAQYFSRSSQWLAWRPSTSPTQAWKAFSGNLTEMSIKYHPDSHSWLAIFPTPGFTTRTASYSVARDLSGRWTEPRPFFSYPEMETNHHSYTPTVFCYAAKEHPELESGTSLSFTYACNSLKEPDIFTDMTLYRPVLVCEKLPFE